MTVTTLSTTITYHGNGATTNFTFPFAMPAGIPAANIGQFLLVQVVNNLGQITVLSQGNNPANYQVSLNAPVSPNPTPIGGQVTYNPSGGPLPTGSTISIARNIPFTQPNSFSNQGTNLPSVVEGTFDLAVMLDQDLNASESVAIVAPFTDPPGLNYTLPPALQRANTGLAFDSQGNVIAGVIPTSGTISSAMQPVVAASTLAIGRTAFGLGNVAVETIGGGLTDDGNGNLIVNSPWISDSTNQPVSFPSFLGTQRAATGPITYTLPLTTGVRNGSSFAIFVKFGTITVTPNAADALFGSGTGTSVLFTTGDFIRLTTDGAGTWHVDRVKPAEDVEIEASVASNNLTVTVGNRFGWLRFADVTIANGDPVWVEIPGNLSIQFASGTTWGIGNNQAFRIWIVAINNAGVMQLAGFCAANPSSGATGVTTGQVFAINESALQSSSGTGVAAGQYFRGNNPAFTNNSIRILGWVEYASGLATAGTYNVAPTRVRAMTPGMKKPGDTGQVQFNVQAAASAPAINFTMESAANAVLLNAYMSQSAAADGTSVGFRMSYTTGPVILVSTAMNVGATSGSLTGVGTYLHFPGQTTPGYNATNTVGTQISAGITGMEIIV